jgi:hypothetical protein
LVEETQEPNVGTIEVFEITTKKGRKIALQIKFYTNGLFLDQMLLRTELRIPFQAISLIPMEYFIEKDDSTYVDTLQSQKMQELSS